MTKQFVHLHLHTDYSLLDGAIKIGPLAQRAAELQMPAVAITDHGNLYGSLSFYNKMKEVGVKPIIGIEAYYTRGSRHEKGEAKLEPGEKATNHIVLLAKDLKGYQNLVKLSSFSFTEGFWRKPRIDKELLAQHSEGIIALSACISGVAPNLLLRDKFEEAARASKEFEEILGKGNYYLEIQEHGLDAQRRIRKPMVELAKKTGIPLVATNDSHYLNATDVKAHDTLLCIGTGKTINDKNRLTYGAPTFYYRTAEEMWEVFGEEPELLTNTLEIAEKCNLTMPKATDHVPVYPVPAGFTIESYFEKVAWDGFETRWQEVWQTLQASGSLRNSLEKYKERLAHEIATVKKMGFPGYFLIVWDFINYAKQHGIPVGPGRGSAAGSLVAYCMKITDVDPLQYDLLFERFLNPERVTMPDVDVDFCVRGRGQVIDYVSNLYGRQNVAQIITFGTMASRAVIKDVGRALEMPYAEVEKVAKMIPPPIRGRNVSIEQALEINPDLKHAVESNEQVAELIETAKRLEGNARHTSIHAAGVVISPVPIHELIPVCKGQNDELTTQFVMSDLEKTGMLKMDFLALTTLTIIEDCLKTIEREFGTRPDLANIPLDDEKALKLFADGHLNAVFQFESGGMVEICRKMKPSNLEDLSALNALYRPGPLDGGMVDDYIERRHGRRKVTYITPEMKSVLENTYGVCVSGDAIVADARTGRRYRLDEVGDVTDFVVQGVDEQWRPARGRVTHWIDSGFKPVFRITLRNGAHLKVTADHRLLTEDGWRPLCELKAGDFIATLDQTVSLSRRALQTQYGFDRQHFKAGKHDRIAAHVVAPLAQQLGLPNTSRNLNVTWEEIVSIEDAGVEHVYDLTVEGLHSFVANNIIVHNCVYQEQIMQLAQRLGGYSLGEADMMRRAMGKKKKEEMAKHQEKFVEGCIANKIAKDKAETIFNLMSQFADYGFNRSHSFAYAWLAYQTAWLKAHYAPHFYAAVLSNESNNTEKLARYVSEMKVFGLQMLPPEVNLSFEGFTPNQKESSVRFGLAAIKGIGSSAVQMIIKAREDGPFTSIFDFAERVDQRAVNKRVMESLIKAGAFDQTNDNRAALLAVMDRAVEYGAKAQRDKESGQTDLFAAFAETTGQKNEPPLPDVKAWSKKEALNYEKEALGFFVSGHPLEEFAESIRSLTSMDAGNLAEQEDGSQVAMGGLIVGLTVKLTKKGDKFAMFQLEDQFGSVKIVCWPEVYNRYKALLEADHAVLIKGKLELTDEGAATIYAAEIMGLESARTSAARGMVLNMTEASVSEARLERLAELLTRHEGHTQIFFDVLTADAQVVRLTPNQFLRVKVTPQLLESVAGICADWKVELKS